MRLALCRWRLVTLEPHSDAMVSITDRLRVVSWAQRAVIRTLLGVLLILFGHLMAAGVTTVCAAVVGLYGAWRHIR